MAPISMDNDSNNGSQHHVHFETIPPSKGKVTIQEKETEDKLQSVETIAQSMKSDAQKAEKWIQNAKIAIDIANNSIREAGKLAEHVQTTAKETADQMTQVTVDTSSSSSKQVEQHEEDPVVVEEDKCAKEFEDVVALQNKAQELQAMVGQTAMQLKGTKSKLLESKLDSAALDMSEQADDLADNLEETIQEIKAKMKHHHHRTSTPVDAEDILKGDTTKVDPLSLDKVDGVLDLRTGTAPKPSSSREKKKKTPVVKDKNALDAEDILKHGGTVKADPTTLDKIDGLPKRTQNAQELVAGI